MQPIRNNETKLNTEKYIARRKSLITLKAVDIPMSDVLISSFQMIFLSMSTEKYIKCKVSSNIRL